MPSVGEFLSPVMHSLVGAGLAPPGVSTISIHPFDPDRMSRHPVAVIASQIAGFFPTQATPASPKTVVV
jgi:hypothetical protein